MSVELKIEYLPVDALKPYEKNARKHTDADVQNIVASIEEFGFDDPIGIWGDENLIVEGHGRLLAAKKLGMETVPIIRLDHLTDEQRRAYALAHNKTAEMSEWDFDILPEELNNIIDIDMEQFGFDINPDDGGDKIPNALRDEFVYPPFSVLDARANSWQERKKAWRQVFDSGNGRDDNLLGVGLKELAKRNGNSTLSGTSIFDPVLCEILINWFCPRGGRIIDPFAGGCVRGVVAAFLDRKYYGNDLSEKQIDANKAEFIGIENEKNFFGDKICWPNWYCGDSSCIDEIIPVSEFDMMLTCPPYADLEVYSDNERDISNMDYPDFIKSYSQIIKKTAAKMKENAFACVVVGEVRDKKGVYRNFIGDTISAAKEAGLKYYNELILVTMVGTGSMRARKPFQSTRKVMNSHQKALVFFKSKDDTDLEEMIKAFSESRATVPMKESVLVFLKGDPREASAPIAKYNFPEF